MAKECSSNLGPKLFLNPVSLSKFYFARCEECNKEFNTKHSLKTHSVIHSGEKNHNCAQCNKSFSQGSNLKTHSLTHTGEKNHRCSQCNYSTNYAAHLRTHVKIHSGEKNHICKQCNKPFSRGENLKTHLFTHTGEKSHICKQCNKSYSRAGDLKTHRFNHSRDKKHRCTQCKFSSHQAVSLRKHTKSHSGEKNHYCAQCNKPFSQLSNLKIHLLTHFGEKKYRCTQCTYSTIRAYCLKVHITTHDGANEHTCLQCKKTFSQAKNLKRHLLTHTGEKIHRCSQCNYSTNQTAHLRRHILTHPSEKPQKWNQWNHSSIILHPWIEKYPNALLLFPIWKITISYTLKNRQLLSGADDYDWSLNHSKIKSSVLLLMAKALGACSANIDRVFASAAYSFFAAYSLPIKLDKSITRRTSTPLTIFNFLSGCCRCCKYKLQLQIQIQKLKKYNTYKTRLSPGPTSTLTIFNFPSFIRPPAANQERVFISVYISVKNVENFQSWWKKLLSKLRKELVVVLFVSVWNSLREVWNIILAEKGLGWNDVIGEKKGWIELVIWSILLIP